MTLRWSSTDSPIRFSFTYILYEHIYIYDTGFHVAFNCVALLTSLLLKPEILVNTFCILHKYLAIKSLPLPKPTSKGYRMCYIKPLYPNLALMGIHQH